MPGIQLEAQRAHPLESISEQPLEEGELCLPLHFSAAQVRSRAHPLPPCRLGHWGKYLPTSETGQLPSELSSLFAMVLVLPSRGLKGLPTTSLHTSGFSHSLRPGMEVGRAPH